MKEKGGDYYKEVRKRSAKKEYARKFRERHPNYHNEKAKEFYHRNKEDINIRKRKNPKVLYGTIKRNALIRKLPIKITQNEFIEWWNSQEQICVYCEIPIERLSILNRNKKMIKRLSIDRLDNEKGYEKGNLALACLQCNFIKSNLFSFEEMREIGQKYIKPKWQS